MEEQLKQQNNKTLLIFDQGYEVWQRTETAVSKRKGNIFNNSAKTLALGFFPEIYFYWTIPCTPGPTTFKSFDIWSIGSKEYSIFILSEYNAPCFFKPKVFMFMCPKIHSRESSIYKSVFILTSVFLFDWNDKLNVILYILIGQY